MENGISSATSRIISELYNDGALNKAVLASLRDATSIADKRAEKAWPIIFGNIDKDYLSKDGIPSYAEVAIFTALRCYAILQQGQEQLVFDKKAKNSSDPHQGVTFFKALNMIRDDDNEAALNRRVDAILSTTSILNTVNSLVHLDKILKGKKKDIKVDFSKLAKDLYLFQMNHDQARNICLNWGQDYYWNTYSLNKEK